MKEFFTTKRICRAGVIAALYVAMTYAFGVLSFQGLLQVRPAEALTILPLFFPEAVPALWIGCMLANLASPFLAYDVPIGGLATLVAALGTYGIGRLIKYDKEMSKLRKALNVLLVVVGGLIPILVNAFVVPGIIIATGGDVDFESPIIAYWYFFASMCATESLWIYGLGIPLYYSILALQKKGISVFMDAPKKDQPQKTE